MKSRWLWDLITSSPRHILTSEALKVAGSRHLHVYTTLIPCAKPFRDLREMGPRAMTKWLFCIILKCLVGMNVNGT